ncbi:MAG: SCP2 sterol-binding domain-containing protein [Candidatus Thorarchaeota archaeon]
MTQKEGSGDISKRKVFPGYSKIKSLVEKPDAEPQEMIKQAFKRGGEQLIKNNILCRVSFISKQDDQVEYYSYETIEKGGVYSEHPLDKPDVEIFIRKNALLEIIQGKLSPIEAIGQRRMRVRGNIKLALKLYKMLAEPEGKIAPCREEEEF